tara:strand:+ start:2214 stop:2876 length:663 start_codon:yes stop_codon:yes gene_type:complete
LKNFGKKMNKNKKNFLYEKRLKILNTAKKYISYEGINKRTFNYLSKDKKINKDELDLLFPEGYQDLISFALDELDKKVENYCKNLDIIRLPVHKRIRKILLAKIFLMNKEKTFYKKIYFNLLLPTKNLFVLKRLYRSIDQIWYLAGDNSVDFNFYTKRLILAAIYSRTILFFFNNNDMDKLELVLDENLKKVSKIPELKSKIKIVKDNFPNILKFVKNFN